MKDRDRNSLPQVVMPANILLTDLEIFFLRAIFHDYAEVVLEKEFGGGFSGTRVLLVLPVRSNGAGDARVVTKLGPAEDLHREFENYQNYVGRALPFTAAQVLPPYEYDGQAALNYVFVGDADLGKSLSLEDYYQNHTVEQVTKTLEDLLGRVLGPMWYGQSHLLTCRFGDEYGHHLPSHKTLKEIVQRIFPNGVSPEGTHVVIPGVSTAFPNPLHHYQGLLDKVLMGRKSFVHGDLHLRNVLVDQSGKAWLIDFAKVRERHNLFDFIKLEIYIRLMILAKAYGGFSLHEYMEFEQALNASVPDSCTPMNPQLKFAYQVILSIREIAETYRSNRRDSKDEYLQALFLYALAMLKYHASNGDVPTRLIFITSCILAKELFEDEESQASENREKSISKKSKENQSTDPEKSGEKSHINTTGGAFIAGNVTVQGDFVGRDKIDQSIVVEDISASTGVAIGQNASANVTETTALTLDEAFLRILEAVKDIREEVEKREATEIIEKLEIEARLGEQAKKERVERWLHFLPDISEDVWDVATNTFINPVKGLGTIFQKIAKKAREEKKEEK